MKSRLTKPVADDVLTILCMAPDPQLQNDDQNVIAIDDSESFRAEVNALRTLKVDAGLLDKLASSNAATDGSTSASAVAAIVANAVKVEAANDEAISAVAAELESFRAAVTRIGVDAETVIATA